MASERIINEYDSTRIANAVDTLATNLADYSGTTVTPTDAMKAKLPSQTTADRIADAVETLAENVTSLNDSVRASYEESPTLYPHSVDDIIYYNGKLYKVITAISTGDTLVVDTNIEETDFDTDTAVYVVNMPGKAEGEIVVSKTSVELSYENPEDTIAFSTNSDGVVSVSSSDPNVATATYQNGQIKIMGVSGGNCNITISVSETPKFTYVSKTISITNTMTKIVSFANGTDEEIKAVLDAYYADEITWEQMGWNIGDTRLIHFNEMDAPSPQASGSKWAAQDIVCVITGHDHHDLVTPINGHTKACITVDTRECLNNGSGNDGVNGIYVNGDSSYDMTFTKWSELYVRTYLNSVVLGAIPSGDFKSAIKPIKHYCHTDYNTVDTELVVDTLYLRSYPEMRGTEEYPNYVPTSPVEGTQLPYYQTSSNRIKYGNNNGEPGETWLYWLSSPATIIGPGYQRLYIAINGNTGYRSGGAAAGLVVSFDM